MITVFAHMDYHLYYGIFAALFVGFILAMYGLKMILNNTVGQEKADSVFSTIVIGGIIIFFLWVLVFQWIF